MHCRDGKDLLWRFQPRQFHRPHDLADRQVTIPEGKFTKPQIQVLWDAYKIRKAALTPQLSAFAQKVIKRLSEPGVNIRRAKYWLYNEAPAKLNPAELASAWQVIKAKEAVIPDGKEDESVVSTDC